MSPDITTGFSHCHRASEGKLMFDDAPEKSQRSSTRDRDNQAFQGNLNLRKILKREMDLSKPTQATAQEKRRV